MPAYDLVVIGSGPAGQRAAVQAAKLGKRVAVIERQRVVGGVSVNTGTVPSKTLREVVRDQLLRNGVELFEGDGAFESPTRIAVRHEGRIRSLETAFVVIAVGTRPGIPPGIEVDHLGVMTSDDVLSLETLPRSLAIVGAGVIGIEYATIFAALGI